MTSRNAVVCSPTVQMCSAFPGTQTIVPCNVWGENLPYGITNRGLNIDLCLRVIDTGSNKGLYMAALNFLNQDTPARSLAIYLTKVSDGGNDFARVQNNSLPVVVIADRGSLPEIFVLQSVSYGNREILHRLHIFRINFISSQYQWVAADDLHQFDEADRRLLESHESLRPPGRLFKVPRAAYQVSVLLYLH